MYFTNTSSWKLIIIQHFPLNIILTSLSAHVLGLDPTSTAASIEEKLKVCHILPKVFWLKNRFLQITEPYFSSVCVHNCNVFQVCFLACPLQRIILSMPLTNSSCFDQFLSNTKALIKPLRTFTLLSSTPTHYICILPLRKPWRLPMHLWLWNTCLITQHACQLETYAHAEPCPSLRQMSLPYSKAACLV